MREVDNGIPSLIDLVEDKVTEELDDVSVASFGPPGFTSKPRAMRELCEEGNIAYILGPFIDEAKFAEEADETSVLEFTHELAFQSVDRAEYPEKDQNASDISINKTHFCDSSISVRSRLPIMSNSCPIV